MTAKLCRHCQSRRQAKTHASRYRGLCRRCYDQLAIREQYTVVRCCAICRRCVVETRSTNGAV